MFELPTFTPLLKQLESLMDKQRIAALEAKLAATEQRISELERAESCACECERQKAREEKLKQGEASARLSKAVADYNETCTNLRCAIETAHGTGLHISGMFTHDSLERIAKKRARMRMRPRTEIPWTVREGPNEIIMVTRPAE